MKQKALTGRITGFVLTVLMILLTTCSLMTESVSASDAVQPNRAGTPYYTLKFTYNDKEFILAGDSTAEVSDVLKRGGISGNPSAVSVSNEDLFSASNENGTWKVTAHQPFQSDEWMKVTAGGTEYTIPVKAETSSYYGTTNDNIKFEGKNLVLYVADGQSYTIDNSTSSDNRMSNGEILYKWEIRLYMLWNGARVCEISGMNADTGHKDSVSFLLEDGCNAWYLHPSYSGNGEQFWCIQSYNISDPDYSIAGGYKIQYDGQAHELVTGVGKSGPRHYRYNKDGGDWSNWSGSVPKATEVGTYQIQWYSEGANSWNNPYFPKGSALEPVETVATTIVSDAATIPTITGWSGVYDANAHSVQASGATGGTVYYRTSNDGEHWGKWSKTVPSRTDAGVTYVEAYTKGDSDHIDSGITEAVEINISKADPAAAAPSATAVYGQTLADVALSNPADNTPGTWTWTDDTQDVGTVGSHTYKADFTPEDTSNYNSKSDVDVVVTVGRADNPVQVRNRAEVTKGGQTVDLSKNITMNKATGAVSYEISGDKLGCSVNDGILTSGDSAGNVTVNVAVAEDDNYKALAKTPITVTITDKALQTITADDVTATYGDKDKAISAGVTAPEGGGGEITYAVKSGSEDYIDVDSSTGALKIKKVPANGKAYVTVTAAGTEDLEQETKDVTVTINKADTVSAQVTANDRVANGREKPLVNVEDQKLVRGTMYYALGEDASNAPADSAYTEDIPKASAAGTYYVWYKVTGDENHNDVDPACVTVTVSEKEADAEASGALAYLISSKEDWNRFAAKVNKGESFKGINVRLTEDIAVTTMAGTDANRFKGTFDGDGHTLTVNYTADEEYTAPFRYTENAKFYNLKISGTIDTSKQFAAGFVGQVKGNTTFDSCYSNVTINSSVSGDGTHGGFVARADADSTSTSFTDCLFDGNITGRKTNHCGGFVGWGNDKTVELKNCLNAGEYTTNPDDCGTFSRGSKTVLHNCYYTAVYGTAQGSQTYATGNQLKGLLGDGWIVSGDEVIPGKTQVGAILGEGTVEDPYLIQEEADWNNFAQRVNSGNRFTGRSIILTKDISVTTMAGTSSNRFCGYFDGKGHTITFNCSTGEDYAAPFRYVNGAKFYNLKVTGTIESSKKFAAGFVGSSNGNTSFTSCHSNITIRSSVDGDGTHGGFVAMTGKTTSFVDCLFDGKLLGEATTKCGGFVGWPGSNTVSFKNCLNDGTFTTVADESGTFTRVNEEKNITIDNCYYKASYGLEQGTKTDKTGEDLKAQLGDGWIVSDNNSVIPKTSNSPKELSAVVDYDRVKYLGIEWIVLDADYTNGYTSEEAYNAGGPHAPGMLLLTVDDQGEVSASERRNWCTNFYNNIKDAHKGAIIGVKAEDLDGLGSNGEDKVFFLSESEFKYYNGGTNYHKNIPRVNYWFLRTAGKCVGNGSYNYDAEIRDLWGTHYARPALNLDPDKVFFTANPKYTEGGSEPKFLIESKEGTVADAKEALQTAMDKAASTRDYVAKGYTADSKQLVSDKIDAGQACLDKKYPYATEAEAKASRKEILDAKTAIEAAVEDLTTEKYEVPGTDYTIKAGNEIIADGVDTSVSEAGGRAYTGTPMFRVLKVEDGRMLLMSEYLWAGGKGSASYDRVAFNSSENNAWQGSQVQDWAAAFNADILSQIEGINVGKLSSDKTDKAYSPADDQMSGNGFSFGESDGILTSDDEVFFLSGEEALEFMKNSDDRVAKLYDEDGVGDAAIWWLRSPIQGSNEAGHIKDNGAAGTRSANKGCYMRPVFWADMNGIDADSISRSSKDVEGTSRTVYTIAIAHVHDWEEPVFEWSDDNSSAVAKRVCKDNKAHEESVDAIVTSEVEESTCQKAGIITYTATATFDGVEYTDTKTDGIDVKAHNWNEPEYTWSGDGSLCVAKRHCKNEGCSAEETEVSESTAEEKTAATYEAKGTTTYTATFKNEVFETQTKDIEDIPTLEPDAAANTAKEKINGLPESDEITSADKTAIERARKAYDALSEEQKKSISAATLAKLEAAEAALKDAEKKAGEEAAKKAAEETTGKAAEEKAKTVKTVTVNSSVVNASTINNTVKKAGGSSKYATEIVLGKNVKKISKGAFKNCKNVKTLVVKSKKLKKKSVKASLKGSKITKVKVKVGSKKTNKKYAKRYRKIFTKKNCGKKVKVSA